MNGWSPTDYVLNASAAVTGIVTDQAISREFPISASGAKAMVIKVACSSVAHTGTQTLKLQTAIGSDWVDSKSATFTANGKFYIKLLAENSSDQTYLPLLARGRIVLSQTDVADSVKIDSINVLIEL